ncbi:hypothetical protein LPA44_13150 [Halobacterium sp. KA-4]|uniref:hypothetical protein n=1 Tax=Halobacterium sp. KA-4 TaxID=2896367 RepID=UPI001E2C03E5|nr:hypothetical protein [Halobacterium sp. KA-4]MCD2200833.1 hypothetical protein [Halobacterium sp. KA-4]
MQHETFELLNVAEDVSENVHQVNNLSKSEESREKVIAQAEKLVEKSEEYKQAVKQRNENPKCANRILSIEEAGKAWSLALQMWSELRAEEWESAWDKMVYAQRHAQASVRADMLGDKLNMTPFYKRLNIIEELLFPDQLFSSTGMQIGTGICTLCESEYSECHHIKGQAYNGEFCVVRLEDPKEVDHLALVEDPDDKTLRVDALTPLE